MPNLRRAYANPAIRRDTAASRTEGPSRHSFNRLRSQLIAARRAEAEAKATLRKTNRRFKAIAETASDWFWEMDPDLRFSKMSDRYFDVTGLSPKDRIGKTRPESVGPALLKKDADRWNEHLAMLDARQPFSNFEYTFMAPDGSERHVRINGTPIFDDNGNFEGYCGTGTDLTASVEAQRKIGHEQQLFMGAVESMSDAFALFDPDDRLVFCNERFRNINPGLAKVLAPGMTFEAMVRNNLEHGRLIEALGREEEYIRERLARHQSPKEPTLSQRKDGRWLLIKEEHAPDGSTFLINTDVTKLKQREEALQRAKETAERASGFKSDFLAKMSHELRTPLNAVIGFSEVLKNELFGPIGNAQYLDYAEDIFRSGRHLLDLINDVLDVSKIEAGKYQLNLGDVDLTTLVRETTRSVRAQRSQKELQLRTTVARNLPNIRADERAIRQILLNLLSNAIKFTPEGGRIRVRAAQDRYGDIRIVVSDTGIGIPKDKIETVLTPFVQLGSIDIANGGGTGLGLPIVKTLVQLHGGTLELKSAHGAWTRVSVRLPKQCIVSSNSS